MSLLTRRSPLRVARVGAALVLAVTQLAACASADGGAPSAEVAADDSLRATLARYPAAARLAAHASPIAHDGATAVVLSSGVEARFDPDAPDALRIRLGDRRQIVVRRPDHSAAAATVGERAVVIRDVGRDVDAFVFGADGIEELDLVRSRDGRLAYDLALPEGFSLRAAPDARSISVLDPRGAPWMRIAADGAWDASGNEVDARWTVAGTSIWLTIDEAARWPVLVDPSWQPAGNMVEVRDGQSATLLTDGRVLIAGGITYPSIFETLATAEVYDPRQARFTPTGSMATSRFFHTATLLRNGKVLVVGGQHVVPPDSFVYDASAELWDPASDAFALTGSLAVARGFHTATLLPSGDVLVAGGINTSGSLASAEIYEVATGQFTPTGSLSTKRGQGAAARLPDGRVLVAGGENGPTRWSSAEIFDPAAGGGMGAFSPTGSMTIERSRQTMTLLRSGLVLVAGGENIGGALSSEELFDPAANGGAGAFVATGSMLTKRTRHMASLLPAGQVLFAAGQDGTTLITSTDLYDPGSASCSAAGDMATQRDDATAVMLASGQVLVVGGGVNATAESFDPLGGGTAGATASVAAMAAARAGQTATRLPSGKILIAGGSDVNGNALATAELFDPSGGGTFVAAGSMNAPRAKHAAALLANGDVLLTGGVGAGGGTNDTAEVFDAALGTFAMVGKMSGARSSHTATLLATGQVLVAGGIAGAPTSLSTAELFDPATSAFVPLPNLLAPRAGHSATLLPSGAVVLVGGLQSTTAELYRPGSNGIGTFVATGSPLQARVAHTATLLGSGKVLVAGGADPVSPLASCELFDPYAGGGTGAFVATGSMTTARASPMAVLMPSGKVLLAGGCSVAYCTGRTATAELYDPNANGGAGAFAATTSLSEARDGGAAALLATGDVLLTGGATATANATASADRWSDGAPIAPAWRAVVTAAPTAAQMGTSIAIGGVGFTGLSEGSSGRTTSSASNNPIPVWLPAAGGMVVGPLAPWQASGGTWTPPASALAGPGWLHVVVDGIVGPGRYIALAQAPAGTHCSVAAQCASGFCVDGVCCQEACDTACVACIAAKKSSGGGDGVCGPIAANTDPDSECGVQAPSTCGTTGQCDGAGHCAVYPSGTGCAPASCSGVILSPEYTCDGAGTCSATPILNCAPFLCQGAGATAACTTSCAADADCAPGAFCSGSVCTDPQTNGAPCDAGSECQSGQCVDGVCCNSDCSGTCLACSAAAKGSGGDGICGPVADGADPKDDCAPADPSTCGFDGTCNGAAACRLYSATTPCGTTTCVDGLNGAHSKQGGQFCDGFGTCTVAQGLDCSLYRCTGDVCGTSCATSADCIVSAYCDASGACQPKHAAADPCEADVECETHHCADGVCCDVACVGQCEACDVLGELGICSPVEGDPHGLRDKCTAEPDCGGTCDGKNRKACTYPDESMRCGAATCSDGIAHELRCDGKGACDVPAEVKCDPFSCSASGLCNTACMTDADCNALFRCDQGECVPQVTTVCDGEHTLVAANGGAVDCSPYRCTAANSCLSDCASSADCVPGSQCSADARCTDPVLRFVPDASCGCRAVGASETTGDGLRALVVALGLFIARRRRRVAFIAERASCTSSVSTAAARSAPRGDTPPARRPSNGETPC